MTLELFPDEVQSGDADRQSWATPPPLFDGLHREYGFTIDLAAADWNAKLPQFISEEDDSLKVEWLAGWRGWCNPPYRKLLPWFAKAAHACNNGMFSAWLVPGSLCAEWFTFAMRAQWWTFDNRIRFVPPAGIVDKSGPAFDPVLVVFDPDTEERGFMGVRSHQDGRARYHRHTTSGLIVA